MKFSYKTSSESSLYLLLPSAATVAEPATKYCMEHVEPYLSAVLEELMGPISLGFKDARELSEAMMDQLYQEYQNGMTKDEVQLVSQRP